MPVLWDNINYTASRALSSTSGHLFCSGTCWPHTALRAGKHARAISADISSVFKLGNEYSLHPIPTHQIYQEMTDTKARRFIHT